MKTLWRKASRLRHTPQTLAAAALGLLLAAPAFAQGTSPWENAVNVLQTAFTSTIARGLSLVAIVVAGVTLRFGVGGSELIIAGVDFGVWPGNPRLVLLPHAFSRPRTPERHRRRAP